MAKETPPSSPNFTAFITMTVGILLFFGMVSHIHELPRVIRPEEATTEAERRAAKLEELNDERQRVYVLFGEGEARQTIPERVVQPVNGGEVPVRRAPAQETPVPAPQPQRGPTRTTPTPHDQRRYHVVQPADTLWRLAVRYYGNGNLHPLILQANPGLDPSAMPVGASLIIPDATPAQAQAPR